MESKYLHNLLIVGILLGMVIATRATPFPAPTTGFTAVFFAGPSVLPSGWQAYPGNHTTGGTLGGKGMTGDQCFAAIAANPTYQAVDFNSELGTCWCHDSTRKCNALTPNNIVYHAKKSPPCTVITGTTTPYPAPVATAP